MIAALVLDPLPADTPPGLNYATATLHVRKLGEKEPGTSLGVKGQAFCWSPDGTEIVGTDLEYAPSQPGAVNLPQPKCLHFRVNVVTKQKTTLKLPDNHVVTDWSRDGKFLLTTSLGEKDGQPLARLHLMNLDGTEHKALTDGKQPAVGGRISPDGKRVLFMEVIVSKDSARPGHKLFVLEMANGKVAKVEDVPLNAELQSYCWSPDGKRIAYAWREILEGKPEDVANKERECFLVVCDPDGKNAKTIATGKAENGIIAIGGVDWR